MNPDPGPTPSPLDLSSTISQSESSSAPVVDRFGPTVSIDSLVPVGSHGRSHRYASAIPSELAEMLGMVHVLARDLDDRIIFWNGGAEALYGYKPEEALGRSAHELLRTIPTAPMEELRGRLFREGEWQGELVHFTKDGRRIVVASHWIFHKDDQGKSTAIVEVNNDITAQKEAEESLRGMEERFRLMVENVEDYAIFMLDPAGCIVSWNTGAERIKGWKAEEVIGQHYSIFYSEEANRTQHPRQELEIAAAEGRFSDEGERVRKDGSRFWAHVALSPLRDETGKITGFARVTRDITERKRAEELLQEGARRKDEFLAMLAHELRNPLAAICNAVQLLDSSSNDLGQPVRWAGSVIARQSQQLTRMVDDLLDVARLTRGAIQLRLEPLDLAAVITHAVDAVRSKLEERQHTLDLSLVPCSLLVRGDAARLEQVITNLLTNACKYTEPGGRIAIRTECDHGMVVVRVQDNGMGISTDTLPQIWELFSQGDQTLARSHGGLGIGLAVVRRIIEMHGGSAEAHSAGLGQGAEFIVRLPQALDSSETQGAATGAARISEGIKRRILIVDDNVDSARTLGRLLERQGHSVLVVHDGPRALSAAPEYMPDTVLLDIGLPGMDGYAIARRLRSNGFAKTLIIAISGYGQEQDRTESKAAGFDHHLLKPVDFSVLTSLLAPPRG